MRIVHLITRLILGGAQENTVFTCLDLAQTYGDDVLLITGPGLGPEGSLVEQARAGGVPMCVISSLRRAIHPGRDVASYRAIRRELARFQPDVVHTHSGKTGLFGRAAAWSLRVPVVVHTVHGAPFHAYQGRGARALFRSCEKYASARCHHIISVADAMTDQLVAAGVAPREKFTTVYSGMDVEPLLRANEHRQRVRSEFGFQDEDIVVGKIARLFHLKGHDDVIAAARLAIEREPRLCFLFVGDGIFRSRLLQSIADAGMKDRFRFTGLVPPEQIPELIAATDMVVHASLREGLARVLPQALIAGRPVISYDIDGAREVVLDNETGVLLRPRDVEGMAEAFLRLAGDPTLRDRLGQEGRRRFTDRFRHETMTADLRAIYQRILGQWSGDLSSGNLSSGDLGHGHCPSGEK